MVFCISMTVGEMVTYAITFLAVYVQIFMLVTFFERRKELQKSFDAPLPTLTHFPKVAIIVPCWNEETTVHGTILSLLNLNYPSDKLEIIVVDDGSTDTTWAEICKYKDNPQVKIFQKENGGKHTAVNFGIEHTDADLIGCLDADSFVEPDALIYMVDAFNTHPDIMATAPSMIIHKPGNMLQYAQKVEYNMSAYNKKMLSFMNAIHVTPGPFSIFRKEVFQTIGLFRKAHGTEDQEIAYRMQEHHMRIFHSHKSVVYTSSPDTLKKLYKQRLRWIYGFIQNTIDYRRLIFKTKYGNFSFFTLPSGIISITAVVYLSFALFYNFVIFVIKKITQLSVTGWSASSVGLHLDAFFISTRTIVFVEAIIYILVVFSIMMGMKISGQRRKFDWHIILYVIVYSVIAPFWLLKAVWNTLRGRRQPAWR